jgi:hypothetical protein
MPLKNGEWKMNENGIETMLTIGSVDPQSGSFLGAITNSGSLSGLWDETSRTITFACPPTISGVSASPVSPRWYKGFLFSTPRNPAPGQDVVWTLAGFVQTNDLDAAVSMGGNARRNVFGWFAQITEVA